MASVSVVVACFANERWPDTRAAVASVLSQTQAASEIILVVDHNPQLASRASRELEGITVLENLGARGAADSRNTGAAAATGELLAFLDDDAVAEPGWLDALLTAMTDGTALGAGGPLLPLWTDGRPKWFPEEFGWVVGASHERPSRRPAPVRNVWAGNMMVRAALFAPAGGFRADFTKVGARARPEDTEFCLRLARLNPGKHWVSSPHARVHHKVPPQRSTFAFFLRRCFVEGAGKVDMAGLVGWRRLTSEADYAVALVPRALGGHLVGAAQGDLDQGRQALVAVFGLVAAGVGAASALVRASATAIRRGGILPTGVTLFLFPHVH